MALTDTKTDDDWERMARDITTLAQRVNLLESQLRLAAGALREAETDEQRCSVADELDWIVG